MSERCLKAESQTDVLSFRDSVLAYLREEREFIRQDIEKHKSLTPEELEQVGLLIRAAKLVGEDGKCVTYETPVNLTKLRPGDEVTIVDIRRGESHIAHVDANDIDRMSFTYEADVTHPPVADVVVREMDGAIDGIIDIVSSYRLGSPGLYYLQILAGLAEPRMIGLGAILDLPETELPHSFNVAQRDSVVMAIKRPSMCYVQGTPGSGKTHLLSVVASVYAQRGKDVVIMALTHQAVNNALNKIVSIAGPVPVAKIGKPFKNIGLDSRVEQSEKYVEYLASRRKEGGFFGGIGNVVGMTFQSALTNLGKIKSAFTPQVILFDEAGQIPLTHAAAIGAFGCGSVVFVGDDAQMPPIYHERLNRSRLSVSVFERFKELYPSAGTVLNVTYRMSTEIANFVSERYYRPRNVQLISAPGSVGNQLADSRPEWLAEGKKAIEFVECSCPGTTDENPIEAAEVVARVATLHEHGLAFNRMAVITPYRRQVRLIAHLLNKRFPTEEDLPLVDTVERLQGQDVDVILASFAADDEKYIAENSSFVLNPNRLNVMFSRATSRVVIVGSREIRLRLGL